MAAPIVEHEKDDKEDDWLFSSLKRYKCLHVYDLQQAAQVMEWICGDSVTICIAGCSSLSKRNEILELALPKKLSSKENGLCKDRDFKLLCGGFTEEPVCELKHVPGGRCIVTSEKGNNSVHLWTLGDDISDVVTKKISMKGRTPNTSPKLAVLSPSKLVYGTNMGDLLVGELHTYQTMGSIVTDSIKSDSYAICNIAMLDRNTCIMCQEQTGVFHTYDIREHKLQRVRQPQRTSDSWTFTVKQTGHPQVAQCDSQCNMILFDLRHPGKDILKTQLKVDDSPNSHVPHRSGIQIQFAPNQQDNILSLSGCNGMVYLYDINDTSETLDYVVPYFTHEGHVKESEAPGDITVLSHSWHPSHTNVIISAASDASLHAWQYEPQSQKT